MLKLKLREMPQWTAAQCVAVYRSLDYQGCGEWYSDKTDEWLDSSEVGNLHASMAHFYNESLIKTEVVDEDA